MPYCYVYQCPHCRFDLEIVGAREFCEGPDGTREDYLYPDADTPEWPPKRVAGLWSRLWCSTCRAVQPFVLLELETPSPTPSYAFFAAEERRLTGLEVGPCPECGAMLTFEVEGELCPACDQGQLTLLGEYEP
jgi:hypothetical protein